MAEFKLLTENIAEQHGPYAEADLNDGRVIHINPLTFGRARLSIGRKDQQWYDDSW